MMNKVVYGRGGISARVLAHSAFGGAELVTYELTYPRVIHAELMTHCMLAKNAASTRAVPVSAVIDAICRSSYRPIHWGVNRPGMQSTDELQGDHLHQAKRILDNLEATIIDAVKELTHKDGINGHKQWAGRFLEPFSMMKSVVSGTEWNNFFWLRDHSAAQPEIAELARTMQTALEISEVRFMTEGDWHLPYIDCDNGEYFTPERERVSLEEARMISASCCAQVSYRKLNTSGEKAIDIYNKLCLTSDNPDDRKHASPTEHQGMAMHLSEMVPFEPLTWEPGVTHVDKDGTLWSAKFRNFIQNRHLIPGESVRG